MYDLLVQIIKYGFSTILLLTSLFSFYISFKEKKSYKFLFQWFSLIGYVLLSASLLLMFFTNYHEKDVSLTFIKGISTAFSFVYGVYATLNGFHETNPETGKRQLTKFGVIGILIFCFNTVFSVSLDFLKEATEQEAKLKEKLEVLEKEQKRKQEYENLIGSVGFVEKKAGDLKIDFQKFSESLYHNLSKTEQELREANGLLTVKETELKETLTKLATGDILLKQLTESFSKSERNLATRDAELKEAQGRLSSSETVMKQSAEQIMKLEKNITARETEIRNAGTILSHLEINFKKLQDEHGKIDKLIVMRETELKESQMRSGNFENTLKHTQEQLNRTERNLVSRETENKEIILKLSAIESAHRKLQDDFLKTEKNFSSKETELKDLSTRLSQTESNLRREVEEHLKTQRLLGSKETELKYCGSKPMEPKS
ncbi:MAG: hypothetical protein K8R21_03175 [Leptospira sp.]|nr:hypothetical protein [Leptospira sp.]